MRKKRVIPAFNYFRVNYNISHRKTPGERCTYFSAKKKKSKLCVVNYLFTFISNYLNELKKILNEDKHFFWRSKKIYHWAPHRPKKSKNESAYFVLCLNNQQSFIRIRSNDSRVVTLQTDKQSDRQTAKSSSYNLDLTPFGQ